MKLSKSSFSFLETPQLLAEDVQADLNVGVNGP